MNFTSLLERVMKKSNFCDEHSVSARFREFSMAIQFNTKLAVHTCRFPKLVTNPR